MERGAARSAYDSRVNQQSTAASFPLPQRESARSGQAQAGIDDIQTAAAVGLSPLSRIHAAYLHVPFCFHKCHYCDFYSFVDAKDRQEPFVDRLIAELRAYADFRGTDGDVLETIFVGGGTPTLLRPDLWRRLLPELRRCLRPAAEAEFTVEANPETVTPELAAILAQGGVNRVSIGAQSFHPRHLKTLERWHDPANVERAMMIFRDAGITNLNLDLIFAIPGQTVDDWLADLEQAVALEPMHLSCYGLTYEPNTAMTVRLRAGRIEPVDEEVEAAMYESALDRLAEAGFEQYEISNWSRPGMASRHNLHYWRNGNWWAFGPSASGHLDGVRWKNVPRLSDYLAVTPWSPVTDVEGMDADRRLGERLMLGLRLREGLLHADLRTWLADDAEGRWGVIEQAMKARMMELHQDRIRLTRQGMLVADSILADLV